jgi:uncharacterized membrane protein YsdA (DUF1294 family)
MQVNILLIPFLIISLVAVIITILDKYRAKSRAWRVPEKILLIISFFGGSISMFITMLLIRHKTRHMKFMIGIPFIFIIQCVTIYFAFKYGILKY